MSQREYLRAMDASIAGAFAGVGMTDTGCWVGKGKHRADGITIMVDHDIETMGATGELVTDQTVCWLYLDQIGRDCVARGDTITIDGGPTYEVERVGSRDESAVQVFVRRKR